MLPYSNTNLSNFDTLSQVNWLKIIPITVAHTPTAYMWEIILPIPPGQALYEMSAFVFLGVANETIVSLCEPDTHQFF